MYIGFCWKFLFVQNWDKSSLNEPPKLYLYFFLDSLDLFFHEVNKHE